MYRVGRQSPPILIGMAACPISNILHHPLSAGKNQRNVNGATTIREI